MKTNLKLKKIIVLSIVVICLVLSATFFYINNDLVISKMTYQTPAEISKNGLGTAGQKGVADTALVIDPTGVANEADLDMFFGVEEPADNFDDLVM